jgi:AcrR family transcriptional regulator
MAGMDAASDDPRAARSKRALIAAVTELIDQRDLDRISITQVVAAAGVTRPTFYQHFADVSALASAAAIARLDAEFSRHEPAAAPGSGLQSVEPVVRELLEHLARHRDFYRRVLGTARSTGAATNAAVELVARRILDRGPLAGAAGDSDAEVVRDSVVILSGGIVWLLSNWLATPLTGRDSVRSMAHRIAVQLVRLAPPPGGAAG